MDHQWRPIPPPHPTSICPICSFSHFPFCPPPPPPPPPPPQYNQSPRFPPPPPQPEHPYHSGPPNPYMVVNPNQGWQWHREDGYGHPNPMYDYYRNSAASCINGEADRSYKRPRVDGSIGSGMFGYENNQSPANLFSDDERRLKLIREHGNTTSLYSPFPPTHDDMNNNNWKNQPMPNSAEMRRQQLPIESVYHENNRAFGGHPPPPPPPPPPTSPPPPLPMEPPLLPSPPKSSSALFPVPINSAATNPYLHNNSSGFVSEVLLLCFAVCFHFGQLESFVITFLVGCLKEWKQSSGKTFLHKKLSPERPIVVDASHLFKMPHRATRPNHIVIILRGLPGEILFSLLELSKYQIEYTSIPMFYIHHESVLFPPLHLSSSQSSSAAMFGKLIFILLSARFEEAGLLSEQTKD